MKHVSQFLLVSSLSLIAFSGEGSILASAPPHRANRKPAIEARVYVEDPSSPSGLYYYDYKDQRPEQGQNPPLQPSTF
jgi:hypothetical protein